MNTIYEQIETQIKNNIAEQPHPTTCTITKIYSNDQHADIHTKRYGDITYVPLLAPCQTGDTGILIFLDNNFNERVVIPQIGLINPEEESIE